MKWTTTATKLRALIREDGNYIHIDDLIRWLMECAIKNEGETGDTLISLARRLQRDVQPSSENDITTS